MRPLLLVALVAGCGSPASQGTGGGSASPLKATALSVGFASACAVVDDGGVVCWGSEVPGLLGRGSNAPASTPTPTRVSGIDERVTSLAMGSNSACAVTATGRVWCWGTNCYDANGPPALCLTGGDGGQFGQAGRNTEWIPAPIEGLSGHATAVSVGEGFACALLAGGTVECWGAGDLGQTGNQDMSNLVPVPVSGLEHVTALSAGATSACAITAGGGVVCWGGNAAGQLGDNSTANSAVPVQVSGLTTGVTAVALASLLDEACAVTGGGGGVCWGVNGVAQALSVGPARTSAPAPIAGLAQGMTAVSLGVNGEDGCALTRAGGVVCWGGGAQGELGNGSTANSAAPVQVAGLTHGVASVSVGNGFACALTLAGGVECWGALLGEQITSAAGAASCRYSISDMPCSDKPLPVAGF